MGLETTNVITGLDATYPTTGDAIQQGDDHIRLIKAVLKHCFPNVNGPLNATMIPFTPVGGITAATVAAALAELDTKKVPLTGTGATGTWGISISGNAATATLATNATNAATAAAVADGAVSTSAKIAANVVTNAKLARAGTAGQILTSGGEGADPYWATPAAPGGVTSVNGNTGAITAGQIAAAATAGYGYTPANVSHGHAYAGMDAIVGLSSVDSSNRMTCTRANGSTFLVTTFSPNYGACLHPYTLVRTLMGDKAILDVRPGEMVLTPEGWATVLGVWESSLGTRPMVVVNGKAVCTPGHLLPLAAGGWAAFSVEEYEKMDKGKTRPVKLGDGLRLVTAPEVTAEQLEVGMEILTMDGGTVITSLEEFTFDAPSLPVYSLVLAGAKSFFADGIAVGTLGE